MKVNCNIKIEQIFVSTWNLDQKKANVISKLKAGSEPEYEILAKNRWPTFSTAMVWKIYSLNI